MTPDDVMKRVRAIKLLAEDDEKAHAEEDRLYRDVLYEISRGHVDDPDSVAACALMTQDIAFSRWYA